MPNSTEKSTVLKNAELDYSHAIRVEGKLLIIGVLLLLSALVLEYNQIEFYQAAIFRFGVGFVIITALANIERGAFERELAEVRKTTETLRVTEEKKSSKEPHRTWDTTGKGSYIQYFKAIKT